MLKHNAQYDRIKKYDWVWGDGLIGKSACHIHIKTWLQIPRTYIKGGKVVYVSVIRSLLTRRWEVGMRNLQKLVDQLTWNMQKTMKKSCHKQGGRWGPASEVVLWSPHAYHGIQNTHTHTHVRFQRADRNMRKAHMHGICGFIKQVPLSLSAPFTTWDSGRKRSWRTRHTIFRLLHLPASGPVRSEFPLFVVVSCLGLCV